MIGRRVMLVLTICAGAGSAGQLSAQRLPMDVTLEVVEDATTIDAAVMELRPLDASGAPLANPPDEAPPQDRQSPRDGGSPPITDPRPDAGARAEGEPVRSAATESASEPGPAP